MAIGLDEETAEKGAILLSFQVDEVSYKTPPVSPTEITDKSFRNASDMFYRVEVIHTFIKGEAPKAGIDMDMRHFTPEQLARMKAHFGKHSGSICLIHTCVAQV